MAIVLQSGNLVVEKVLKKTKAKMFKDLKVGDKIQISVPVKVPGVNRRTHATYLTVINTNNGEYACKSFNELTPILDCFELVKEEGK